MRVPSLKLRASQKKIIIVFGKMCSSTEKRIGIPSFGRRPGKLFFGVSIQPNKKLWKPYGRPSVCKKNYLALSESNLARISSLNGNQATWKLASSAN